MNYYNPYFYMPYMAPRTSLGLFRGLLGGRINLSSILNGTQKTLNIVNQAIPVFKEVTPMIKNAKTMFRVMSEFRKVDEVNDKLDINDKEDTKNIDNNLPTFFA